MSMDKIVALFGLLIGFVASLFLAISLTRLVRAILLCVNAFDVTIQSYFSHSQGIPVFKGLDKHLQQGVETNKKYNVVGFALLGISFLLQVVALMMTGG
jgi:hypothetical protein